MGSNAHHKGIGRLFRNMIPRRIRAILVSMNQRRVFKKTWPVFSDSLVNGKSISDDLLADLVYGWGNVGFSAHNSYLRAIIDHMKATGGPVLECGSGLSTLVIGILGLKNGLKVYSLEHDTEWAEKIRDKLSKLEITGMQLSHTSLISYGHYSWYDHKGLDLPDDISLIICDGPPAQTPGGRYGLLPEVFQKCRDGCIILLDDYVRPEERKIVSQWSNEYRLEVREKGLVDIYAEIKVIKD